MSCNMEIPSFANTLKKILLSLNIFNESTSTYYDDKNCGLEMLFKQFTEKFVLDSIMESKHGQVRLQKEAKKGFVKSSLKIQLDIIIDQ